MESKSQKIAIPFLITLILISIGGLVGSDMYLPALPEMRQFFGKGAHELQLTLGVYLFGLSFGQLFYGPLSNFFGKRNSLISGYVLYLLSSVLISLISSYYVLLALRFFQALGACSGLVIGRSIVGEKYGKEEAAKIFTLIFPFVGASPAISPIIGALIFQYTKQWTLIFLFIALFALITLAMIISQIAAERNERKAKENLLRSYWQALKNKDILIYIMAPCVAYINYFAYLSQLPFLLKERDYSESQISLFFAALSVTYIAGNLYAKRMLKKKTLEKVLFKGYILFLTGALLALCSGILQNEFFMAVSASIMTLGNGFLIPLGTAGAITATRDHVSYTSAILGFLQLNAASLSASLIGALSRNDILYLGIYLSFFAALAFGLYYRHMKSENYG